MGIKRDCSLGMQKNSKKHREVLVGGIIEVK